MNYHHRSMRPGFAPALPERRRFTASDLLAMDGAGIFRPDERIELIDGEIISMPAKSARHDDASDLLDDLLSKRLPSGIRCVQGATLRLSDTSQPQPDLFAFPRSLRVSEVRGDSVLLVIEVAVSSLSLDLDVMAPLYARHGICEYWVLDARRLLVHVHRDPGPDGYASVRVATAGETLAPLALQGVTLSVAELGLGPLLDAHEE